MEVCRMHILFLIMHIRVMLKLSWGVERSNVHHREKMFLKYRLCGQSDNVFLHQGRGIVKQLSQDLNDDWNYRYNYSLIPNKTQRSVKGS